MKYENAYQYAVGLPKVGSTPIYQDFAGNEFRSETTYFVCFGGTKPDVGGLFAIVAKHCNNRLTIGRGYLYAGQTKIGEDGKILPKGQWRTIVLYHPLWSRKDIEVTNATYDIVGVKRATTHLPAGVLIANIEFEIDLNK